MAKILGFCAAVFAVAALYYYVQNEQARRSLAVYYGNNQVLINQVRKVYHDKLAVERRQEELEQAAKECSLGFDWGFDIGGSPVILRLQAR